MSFFVDVVSEDSFYENLTLGVSKLLEANPCVRNVQLERRGACDRVALSAWEQKHCCLLTEDLRNFYTSTDGFLLTWSLEISGEEFAIGRMEIKELSCLKRFVGTTSGGKEQQADGGGGGGASSSSSSSSTISSTSTTTNDETRPKSSVVEPNFGGSRCKLFELADCADCKVFLAYQLQPDQDEPSVWLHDFETSRWHPLADSFSKYFRMMLVHLGLPLWQICAAGLQMPTWLEQVYLLVGPHLLQSKSQPTPAATVSVETSLWTDGPTNMIDPAVFRGKEHHPHGTGGARQKSTGSGGASGTAPATSTATTTATTGNARKKSSAH